MTTMNPISEEILSAYVDGELDAAESARVQAWLDDHADDRLRVQAWRDDRAALAALFAADAGDRAEGGDGADALRSMVWRGAPARTRWAQAAAAAALVVAGAVLGGGGVWSWQQERLAQHDARLRTQLAAGTAQGWVERAALAHRVYVAEPRHAVEVRAQEEHLAGWLTRRLEIPVKLFDLQDQGYALIGG